MCGVTNEAVEYFEVPGKHDESHVQLHIVWIHLILRLKHFLQAYPIECFESTVYILTSKIQQKLPIISFPNPAHITRSLLFLRLLQESNLCIFLWFHLIDY